MANSTSLNFLAFLLTAFGGVVAVTLVVGGIAQYFLDFSNHFVAFLALVAMLAVGCPASLWWVRFILPYFFPDEEGGTHD